MNNPFDIVYSELWKCVLEHNQADALLKAGNIVRFDEDKNRRPLKDKVSTTSLPELILMPSGMNGNYHNTSSTTKLTKRYTWVLTTGDMRLQKALNPISWLIFVTHVQNQHRLINEVQYNGRNFIKRLDLVDSTDGQSELQRKLNIKGWSSVQAIEVEMHFPKNDLEVSS